MPTTNLPYGYQELYGSAKEVVNSDSGVWETERVFYGPWDDRLSFVQTFLAHSSIDPVTNLLTYFPAAEYPDIPICRAYEARIDGKAKADLNIVTDQIKYETAEITIKYKTLPYQSGASPDLIQDPIQIDQLEFNYLTEEFNSSTETLVIPSTLVSVPANPGGTLMITEGNDSFRYLIGTTYHNITQHMIPEIDWTAIDNCQGTVNSELWITPSKRSMKLGNCLYHGPSGFRKFSTVLLTSNVGGSTQFEKNTMWEITHHFEYKSIRQNGTPLLQSWQRYQNPANGLFEIAQVKDGLGGFINLYDSTDHRTLFQI